MIAAQVGNIIAAVRYAKRREIQNDPKLNIYTAAECLRRMDDVLNNVEHAVNLLQAEVDMGQSKADRRWNQL
jgi:hypothetical protein